MAISDVIEIKDVHVEQEAEAQDDRAKDEASDTSELNLLQRQASKLQRKSPIPFLKKVRSSLRPLVPAR